MDDNPPCAIEDCGTPRRALEPKSYSGTLCNRHRNRYQKLGSPLAGGTIKWRYGGYEEEFLAKTVMTDHGLIWVGLLNKKGYGMMSGGKRGKRRPAHKYAWERANHELPTDHSWNVDHDPGCPKNCVDDRHLTAMTTSEHCKLEWQRGTMGAGRHWGKRQGEFYRK